MQELSLAVVLALAALGVGCGFLAGLLGIGGGMVMVPFLVMILSSLGIANDTAIKVAIATGMSTIIFTSVSSVRAHHKIGAVRWDLVVRLVPGVVVGSVVASLSLFTLIKGSSLALLYALIVTLSATQMLLDRKPRPTRQMPGTWGTLLAGGVIGFMSGLVGAGGGFISVPFMVWCNVQMHTAVATSAALGFPIALTNVVGYVASGLRQGSDVPSYALGFVWLPGLLVTASCSVLAAPFGARCAHQLPVAKLKRVFGAVLYVLAAYMFYRTFAET